MGKGQAYYSLVVEQIGYVKKLTNTCQETPDCGYTEHVVEEQSGTDDELDTWIHSGCGTRCLHDNLDGRIDNGKS